MADIDTSAVFSVKTAELAQPESKTFSLSVPDGADARINLTIHGINASGNSNAANHNIVSINNTDTEVVIYKHLLRSNDVVQLYAAKADLAGAYLVTQLDYENDTSIAVTEINSEVPAETSEYTISGTLVGANGDTYTILVVADDGTGATTLAQTTSNTDSTFSLTWESSWDGDVYVMALSDYGDDWEAGAIKSVGDIVHPSTANGYVYECAEAGTTAAEEPDWSAEADAIVSETKDTMKILYRDSGSSYDVKLYDEATDVSTTILSDLERCLGLAMDYANNVFAMTGSVSGYPDMMIYDLEGTNVYSQSGTNWAYSVTVDRSAQKFYVADAIGSADSVAEWDYTGNVGDDYVTWSNNSECVQIDTTNQKMFVVQESSDTIYMLDISGTLPQNVESDGTAIVAIGGHKRFGIRPSEAKLYFTDGTNTTIQSVDYDGNVEDTGITCVATGSIASDKYGNLFFNDSEGVTYKVEAGTNDVTAVGFNIPNIKYCDIDYDTVDGPTWLSKQYLRPKGSGPITPNLVS